MFVFIPDRIICLLKDKKIELRVAIHWLLIVSGSTMFIWQYNIIWCSFLSLVSEYKTGKRQLGESEKERESNPSIKLMRSGPPYTHIFVTQNKNMGNYILGGLELCIFT